MGAKDQLLCPVCHSSEIQYVEQVGYAIDPRYPIKRYRCKKCGLFFRYDTRPAHDPRRVSTAEALAKPYASFSQGLRAIRGLDKLK